MRRLGAKEHWSTAACHRAMHDPHDEETRTDRRSNRRAGVDSAKDREIKTPGGRGGIVVTIDAAVGNYRRAARECANLL